MVNTRFIEHHIQLIRLDGVEVWHFGGKDMFVGEFLMTLSHVILLVFNERTVEHDAKIIRWAEFVLLHFGRKDVFVG